MAPQPTERDPLLPQSAPAPLAPSDPEASADEHAEDDEDVIIDPAARRRSLIKWSVFWIVFSILTVVLVVEAFKEGGGEFDWTGALKKAGGGVRCPFSGVQKLDECCFRAWGYAWDSRKGRANCTRRRAAALSKQVDSASEEEGGCKD